MEKLNVAEKIRKEENQKIQNLIIGIIIIVLLWIVINLFLKLSPIVKTSSSIVLLLGIVYLVFLWYRYYYK